MKNRTVGVVVMMAGCAAYGQSFSDLSIHPGNGVLTNVAAVSGAVNVTVNPGAGGGGIVALDPASAYYGRTTLGCGTLAVSKFADGGTASAVGASPSAPENLVLGLGTLRYTGGAVTNNRGLTVSVPDGKSAVLHTDSDLTFTGPVVMPSGSFFKTGAGTLAFFGPGTNTLPATSTSLSADDRVAPAANGDSPTTGLNSLYVVNGTVAWGAPGQVMNIGGTDIMIGGYSTTAAGQETTGCIDIYGGTTRFNCWLAIGRNNGTTVTAPVPLEPKLRVFGGTVTGNQLSMGRKRGGLSGTQRVRPTIEVYGGTLTFSDNSGSIRMGDDTGGDSTIRVFGGTFKTGTRLNAGLWGVNTNQMICYNGGYLDLNQFDMGNGNYASQTTIDLLPGARLNGYKFWKTGAAATAIIRFNGGILEPEIWQQYASIQPGVTVYASTNGAVFNTIYTHDGGEYFDLLAPLLHDPALGAEPDGGLVKTGPYRMGMVAGSTYTGPTVISNGTLILKDAALPAATALSILPGATLALTNGIFEQTVASFTAGAPDTPGAWTLAFAAGSRLKVASAFALAGNNPLKIALYDAANGSYTLMQWPTASGPAAFEPARVAVANPVSGKLYTFAVGTSGADTLLIVTVGDGPAGAAWVNPAGGNWSDGSNWSDHAPVNAPGAVATFATEAQSGGATVTIAGTASVGGLALSSVSPYSFTGGALAIDNGAADASWMVTAGDHAAASDVRVDGSALALSTLAGATQTVSGAVSGTGALRLNTAAASGGGTVRFTGTVTSSGGLETGCGTAEVAARPAGPLTLGPGTLRYTGLGAAWDGFTLAPGANRASILRNDGDLTVAAPVTAASGGFIKSGAGTLTLDGAGVFALGVQNVSTPHDFAGYPANGDSPTAGFGSLAVSQGKLAWGAPGQAVSVGSHLHIGTRNANGPGEAVTGELEINGGSAAVSGNLYIGVANGDPVSAPVPLHPRLTVNGGDTAVSGELIMGWDNRTTTAAYLGTQQAQNTQPELVVNGGALRVNGAFYPSYHGGTAPTNRVTINGGELAAKQIYFGYSWFGALAAATTLFEINGGFVNLLEDLRTARFGADSYFRFNGGVLRAWDIQKADGGGNSEVWLNGGVFQPIYTGQATVYRTFDRHTNVWICAGGFIIDTSYWPDPDAANPAYEIYQDMRHDPDLGGTPDGGIVKRGLPGIVIIRPGKRYAFTGPVTVEEGTLGIDSGALWENALVMHDGTTLRLSNKDTVHLVDTFTAGTGSVTLDLSFEANTAKSQPLVVSNALAVTADIVVVGHGDGGYAPALPVGATATVLVCNASQTLDAGRFRASPLFPNRTVGFEKITLAGGPYAGWQAVVMTVADAAPTEHVWNATASGGAWDTAGNWLADAVPPAAPGVSVRFPPAAAAAVAVTPAAETRFGRLTLESAPGLGYAFGGGALAPAEPGTDLPAVTALSGAHSIASPLGAAAQGLWFDTRADASLDVSGAVSGPGRLYVNAASSGGGLTLLSGASTHAGGTEVRSGTLRVTDLAALGGPAPAADNLLVGPGTFHYAGPAASTDLGVRFVPGAAGRPAIIRLDGDLTLTGPASQANGLFAKFGPGTLRLAYPGTNTFSTSSSGDSNSQLAWPTSGDAPAGTAGGRSFVAAGRLVVGGPGQVFTFNNELDIGSQPRGLGDENAYEATMDVIGGTVNLGGQYFGIGVNFKRENGVSTYPTLNIYDGNMTVNHLTMAYDVIWKNHSTKAVLNVYGGSFTVNDQFRLGHHKGNAANPPHATVNVYGGAVHHPHASQGTTFGWMNSGDPKPACTGTLNLFGGDYNERWLMKMANHDAVSYLNLHGGVLRAENITHVAGSVGQSHLFFNGGVYMPLGTNAAQRTLQGLTSATVSTNGAVVDTSLAAAAITFAQRLTHDPALGGAPDGGLTKRGQGMLALAVSNAFTGPVAIEAGALRATVDGAVPDLLHVGSNGAFDADGAVRAIPRLAGSGLCTNGTVRVTGELAAGEGLTLDHLTLAPGAVIRMGAAAAVTGALAAEGGGTLDLGRTEADPLLPPFSIPVATYGSCGSAFAGWRVTGTGWPDGKYAVRFVRDEDGPVKILRAELVPNGTVMMLK
jgi:autotransporter-associated beta strand protein